ncbi:MAG: TetR/AcrR family transcriptional regulator [Spirochaetaceae bacterium]|jgi:hypothetical protein|nr:TetR/AcrR family transcriptional regulator [Spirochaetaceae bacterium]
MGKRNEKKEEIKNRILQGAGEVFEVMGFEDATMQEIARKAEVGLGTAYNYFKSKEELYMLTLADKMNQTTGAPIDVEDNSLSGADMVCQQIIKQLNTLKHIPKSVWKTVFGISFNSMKRDKSLLKKIMMADYQAMDKIAQLIDLLNKKGSLQVQEDPKVISEIIYGSLFLDIMMFVFEEERTFQETCDAICKKIHFILGEKLDF